MVQIVWLCLAHITGLLQSGHDILMAKKGDLHSSLDMFRHEGKTQYKLREMKIASLKRPKIAI